MAATLGDESTMQWNQQGDGFQPINPFSFVDFLPDCSEEGGFFTQPKMESFRTLIDRGNEWLRANRKWKVVTCESVEFIAQGTIAKTNSMTYVEFGKAHTCYMRGLRLWLEKRQDGDTKEQQIGYMNILPDLESKGGIFRSEKYDTLDDVISRFNSSIQMNPIPGKVITIETQEMKSHKLSKLDPDRTRWLEAGSYYNHFIFVIRIFFEISNENLEQIGVEDFFPDLIKEGGKFFSLPQYEPFSNVVKRASDWRAQQGDKHICNIQTLEIRIESGKEVNSQKMNYSEPGGFACFYLRILRIAYTLSYSGLHEPLQLTCKVFVPHQLKESMFSPKYEDLLQTKHRVEEWVKATGAIVVSAETTAMRLYTGGERKQGCEASYTYNCGDNSEWWIFVIKLYFNGYYAEPPPEVLPPIPEVEKGFCNII